MNYVDTWQLLTRCRQGDSLAIEALVQTYGILLPDNRCTHCLAIPWAQRSWPSARMANGYLPATSKTKFEAGVWKAVNYCKPLPDGGKI